MRAGKGKMCPDTGQCPFLDIGLKRFYISDLMAFSVRFRTYKPLKNYLLHGSYLFKIDDKWSVKPTFILRGGQNIPVQTELSSSITWNDRFWGTALFGTGGIIGVGIGGEIYDGIILNYSYNEISNVSLYSFGSHQLTLGIKLFSLWKSKKFQDT